MKGRTKNQPEKQKGNQDSLMTPKLREESIFTRKWSIMSNANQLPEIIQLISGRAKI